MTATLDRPSSAPFATTDTNTLLARATFTGFQTDIEGLRAIAVIAVVAFHAAIPSLRGGFVGVDIFFVISGYLITGLLIREAETTGRIGFFAFYARRAKRILPAVGLVVIATAIAIWFVLPLLSVYTAAKDLLAAVVYVANWRFISLGTNYLAASGTTHSVGLHFWSLAVEEQFYLVWPVIILVIVLAARRLPRARTAILLGGIGAITTASLLASLALTDSAPALAYMSTYTRAWQFGVGGIVAVAMSALRRSGTHLTGRIAGWILGLGGLAALVISCRIISINTPYPGIASLLPTLGAAAIIAGGLMFGTGGLSVGRLLSLWPMREIGRLSFAWYLWHWPLLILVQTKYPEISWKSLSLLMLGALILAKATTMLIERPIMSAKSIKRAGAAICVGVTATLLASAASLIVGSLARNTAAGQHSPAWAITFSKVFGSGGGANSGSVTPTALKAKTDYPMRPCIIDVGSADLPNCDFGSPTGRKVVLFGDSHAHQWQPTFQKLADQYGWNLIVRAKSGCPVLNLAPTADQSVRYSQPDCVNWRAQELREIVDDIKPSMVIVSSFSNYVFDKGPVLANWNNSLDQLRALHVPIVYLRDTPFPGKQIPECISSNLDNWSACAFESYANVASDPVIAQTLSGNEPMVTVVDLNAYLCPTSRCPAVLNGALLYRDDSHLTATAAALMAPAMSEALIKAGLVITTK